MTEPQPNNITTFETSTGLQRVEQKYAMHDIGNGWRFAYDHKDKVRYLPSRKDKGWFIWNGKRWAVDASNYVMELAKKTSHQIEVQAAAAMKTEKDDGIAFAFQNWAEDSQNVGGIKAMLKAAQSDSRLVVRVEDLDSDDHLFNCLNGTLNLKTGELQPFNREDLITQQGRANYLPGVALHPVVAAFLDSKIPKPENRLWLQKYCGSLLSGDTGLGYILFLYGETGGGKSTCMEAITAVMGDYAGGLNVATILKGNRGNQTFDLAAMLGKRYLSCSEIGAHKAFDVERLKMLSGGDMIQQAAQKYGDPFDFRGKMKLVFAANDLPFAPDEDVAFWVRLKQFPMTELDAGFRTKAANHKLVRWVDTLTQDQDAMDSWFTWMVEGWLLLQKDGLGICQDVEDATEEYRKEQNPLKTFFETVAPLAANGITAKAELWRVFKAWQNDQGIPARFAMKQLQFNRRIGDMPGLELKKTTINKQVVEAWHGISLDRNAIAESLAAQLGDLR